MMSSLGCKLASFAINSYYDASGNRGNKYKLQKMQVSLKKIFFLLTGCYWNCQPNSVVVDDDTINTLILLKSRM